MGGSLEGAGERSGACSPGSAYGSEAPGFEYWSEEPGFEYRSGYWSWASGSCGRAARLGAPGVLAPTPIVGKYYTDYSLDFVPPRELGRR